MFITPISLHLDWRIVLTWSKSGSFPKKLDKKWSLEMKASFGHGISIKLNEFRGIGLKLTQDWTIVQQGEVWAILNGNGDFHPRRRRGEGFPPLAMARGVDGGNWPGEEGYNLGRRAPGEQRFLQVGLDKEINIEAIYFGNLLRYSMSAILQLSIFLCVVIFDTQ